MGKLKYLTWLIGVLTFYNAYGQQDTTTNQPVKDALSQSVILLADTGKQKDLIDIFKKVLKKKGSPQKKKPASKANLSVIPYAGYTLSTGFTINLSGNVGFFTDSAHKTKYSVISADISYDSKKQKILLTRSEIWGGQNKYKFVTDLRWERYPTDTYGLGTFTTTATDADVDYYYLRAYETVFKKISGSFYAGIGYNLDDHYGINVQGNADHTVSDFVKYGGAAHSVSSGFNFDFLYDKRTNPLNPSKGSYASLIFRQNSTLLGSNNNWQSLQADVRKYFKLPANSNNILAFWNMDVFTWGKVPYFDLPATGGDMYNNSGRGYAIGRFRGRDMLYLECEYRFGITRNGLLGGVVFANGESFTEYPSNTFKRMAPAIGSGIRLKINKHSDSNICIDYAVGTGGSQGFFVNLGEVF